MFTIACYLVVVVGLGLDLVPGCVHVFVILSIVIVTLPNERRQRGQRHK